METYSKFTVINRDELPRDGDTFAFEGFQYPGTDISLIWVDMPPGGTVRLHKHPYTEIFVIQEGRSTFLVDSVTLEAQAGQIILVPANIPHKFSNSGPTQLRQVDIHLHRHFITDWLED